MGMGQSRRNRILTLKKTEAEFWPRSEFLFTRMAVLLYYPKKTIQVTIFNSHDFMFKMVPKVTLVSINGGILVIENISNTSL